MTSDVIAWAVAIVALAAAAYCFRRLSKVTATLAAEEKINDDLNAGLQRLLDSHDEHKARADQLANAVTDLTTKIGTIHVHAGKLSKHDDAAAAALKRSKFAIERLDDAGKFLDMPEQIDTALQIIERRKDHVFNEMTRLFAEALGVAETAQGNPAGEDAPTKAPEMPAELRSENHAGTLKRGDLAKNLVDPSADPVQVVGFSDYSDTVELAWISDDSGTRATIVEDLERV